MKEIGKILAAICFSDYCHETLDAAATLATKFDAKLLIANVINIRDVKFIGSIENMGYDVHADNYIEGIEQERLAELQKMLHSLDFPIQKIKTIFRVGHPFDELMKIIHDEEVDLVVVGTKGRSDLSHILVGSVAEKIFRHSPVTVVSCRHRSPERRRWRRHAS